MARRDRSPTAARARTYSQELAGLALIAAALFVAGSLIARGVQPGRICLAQSGMFGPIGACLRVTTLAIIGPFGAPFVPALIALYSLRVLGRIDADTERRFRHLAIGLLMVAVVAAALARGAFPGAPGVHSRPDLVGGVAAFLLVRVFGIGGAWLVIGLSGSALVVLTVAGKQGWVGFGWARLRVPGKSRTGSRVDVPVSASITDLPLSQHPIVDARKTPAQPAEAVPPMDLFAAEPEEQRAQPISQLEVVGYRLLGALRNLRIDAEIVGRTNGSAVMRFEIEPAVGTRLPASAALASELSAALRVPAIRIVPAAPGRATFSVEVPNGGGVVVPLREILASENYQSASGALPLALGRDLEGRPVVADLARMPNLLIAGAAGSGKSACIHSLIASLVHSNSSGSLEFVMLAPNGPDGEPAAAELSLYESLPHQRYGIITDPRDAGAALTLVSREMDDRFELFRRNGVRNINEFRWRAHGVASIGGRSARGESVVSQGDSLPYIVVIIEELADLLSAPDNGIEPTLTTIALRGRAVGIHVVVTTSLPAGRLATERVKANFPARIALRVSDAADSRAVLEDAGAESLHGSGDMLFVAPGKTEPSRLQGAFVSAANRAILVRWFADRVSPSAPLLQLLPVSPVAGTGPATPASDLGPVVVTQPTRVALEAQKVFA